MLLQNLRAGQQIRIGETMVTVLSFSRRTGRVRLGFDAPRRIGIWREELLPLARPQCQAETKPEPEPEPDKPKEGKTDER